MKYDDTEVGMKVRLAKDCKITRAKHGFNREMRDMQGKVCIISERLGENSVRIDGWQWNAKDLTPGLSFKGKPPKDPDPVTFDPNLLDL